jgi:hypothetical protein
MNTTLERRLCVLMVITVHIKPVCCAHCWWKYIVRKYIVHRLSYNFIDFHSIGQEVMRTLTYTVFTDFKQSYSEDLPWEPSQHSHSHSHHWHHISFVQNVITIIAIRSCTTTHYNSTQLCTTTFTPRLVHFNEGSLSSLSTCFALHSNRRSTHKL